MIAIMFVSGCARNSPPPPHELRTQYIEHTIRSGESLALIAEWYMGRSQSWREIYLRAERGDPRQLRIGDTVLIPAALAVHTNPPEDSFIKERAAARKKVSTKPKKKSSNEGEPKTVRSTDDVAPSFSIPSDPAPPIQQYIESLDYIKPSPPERHFDPEEAFMEQFIGPPTPSPGR